MLSSHARYFAVMDADLQHDESLLPKMLAALRAGECDLAIGSRYVEGGGVGEWGSSRRIISRVATSIGKRLLRVPVGDPMSGFFMLPRAVFDRAVRRLSAMGFKILLDIVASLPEPPVIRELPYEFRNRQHGESKLDAGVLRDYVLLIVDKLIGHILPVRFVLFAGVGAVGIAAHLLVLTLCLHTLELDFAAAQTVATAVAILGNFLLNNVFTFSDRRLKGMGFVWGLLTFAAISAVGAVLNINIASVLFGPAHWRWYFAGFAGAAMSLVWNYAVSSAVTWRR